MPPYKPLQVYTLNSLLLYTTLRDSAVGLSADSAYLHAGVVHFSPACGSKKTTTFAALPDAQQHPPTSTLCLMCFQYSFTKFQANPVLVEKLQNSLHPLLEAAVLLSVSVNVSKKDAENLFSLQLMYSVWNILYDLYIVYEKSNVQNAHLLRFCTELVGVIAAISRGHDLVPVFDSDLLEELAVVNYKWNDWMIVNFFTPKAPHVLFNPFA